MSASGPGPSARASGRSCGFIATGATATPQAVVEHLKRMDQQRKARNNKRAQRKRDGDSNVSSDEEDESTPILVTAGNGIFRQPQSGPCGRYASPLLGAPRPLFHIQRL
ncbi:hypothetical protein B0H13DRAFT_1864144 [Mycena leptocephala]|nr:hypothetical protein B0H13DRAFT_1864144 [Mycena leptocephala]